jgi:hypothetical protein
MHGPPLTRLEVEAVLRSEVKRLISRRVEKQIAIEIVAEEHGIDPEWVAQLVDGEPGGEA